MVLKLHIKETSPFLTFSAMDIPQMSQPCNPDQEKHSQIGWFFSTGIQTSQHPETEQLCGAQDWALQSKKQLQRQEEKAPLWF